MRFNIRLTDNQFGRFILVGGLNTLVTYGIYLVLKRMIEYQAAFLIAYIAGIIFSYLLNALFVFKHKLTFKTFFSFPVVYIVQYIASAILLDILVRKADISTNLAPIIVIFITVPLTFLVCRAIFTQQQM